MKKQSHLKLWVLALVAVFLFFAWLFRPSPKFQGERIDSELPKIGEPLQTVRVASYLDGGSISVELIRTNGQSITCFLQVTAASNPKWEKIFIGAKLKGKELGRELPFPADHRNYLIAQIESFAPKDDMKVLALADLRGYARDYVSVWLFRFGL